MAWIFNLKNTTLRFKNSTKQKPLTHTAVKFLTSLSATTPTSLPILVTYAWLSPSSENRVWVCGDSQKRSHVKLRQTSSSQTKVGLFTSVCESRQFTGDELPCQFCLDTMSSRQEDGSRLRSRLQVNYSTGKSLKMFLCTKYSVPIPAKVTL